MKKFGIVTTIIAGIGGVVAASVYGVYKAMCDYNSRSKNCDNNTLLTSETKTNKSYPSDYVFPIKFNGLTYGFSDDGIHLIKYFIRGYNNEMFIIIPRDENGFPIYLEQTVSEVIGALKMKDDAEVCWTTMEPRHYTRKIVNAYNDRTLVRDLVG
jgi:hypothetical protein